MKKLILLMFIFVGCNPAWATPPPTQLKSDNVVIGSGANAVNKVLEFNTGVGANPKIRANLSTGLLEISNDGSTFYNISSRTRTINAQSGTTYTFALSDGSNAGTSPLVTFGSGSATTVTIPPNSSVAFPVGAVIECIRMGAGTVTFAPGAGVTINSVGGLLGISNQYVGVSLVQTSANVWVILGSLQ